MKLSLVTGPGSHGHSLLSAILKGKADVDHYHYWPKYSKHEIYGPSTVVHHNKIIDLISKTIYLAWNNVPFLNHKPRHLSFLYDISDFYTAKNIDSNHILWAWVQISNLTIKKFKKSAFNGFVILENPMVDPFFQNEIILRERKYLGLRTPHFQSFLSSRMINRVVEEIENSKEVRILSNFALSTFNRNKYKTNFKISSLGVDTNLFSPSLIAKRPLSETIFIYVGRIEIWKGVHYLLQSFARIKNPTVKLWLVGHICEEMREYLSIHLSDARIQHFPFLKTDELVNLYNTAHCLVFPTLMDSFGMVILEAMSCGCPAIATMSSAAPEIIENEVDGFLVNSADSDALYLSMQNYISLDDTDRLRLSNSARNKALKKYSLEHYYSSVLSDLISYVNIQRP